MKHRSCFRQDELRRQAWKLKRKDMPEEAAALWYLADVLDRANNVRSDALNVVNYVLNGGEHMEEETKDSVSDDVLEALTAQLDHADGVTAETTFESLNLDSLTQLSLLAAARVLLEDGKVARTPKNTAELLACKTFGGLVAFLTDGDDKDSVMLDFDRLRNLVDDKVAIGAVAFQVLSGRWSASLDRSPTTYGEKLTFRRVAYRRAGQYLAEGMTHFTIIEGPWTVSLKEPS